MKPTFSPAATGLKDKHKCRLLAAKTCSQWFTWDPTPTLSYLACTWTPIPRAQIWHLRTFARQLPGSDEWSQLALERRSSTAWWPFWICGGCCCKTRLLSPTSANRGEQAAFKRSQAGIHAEPMCQVSAPVELQLLASRNFFSCSQRDLLPRTLRLQGQRSRD